jgi:molybdenum cofactor biosynthesis protein A
MLTDNHGRKIDYLRLALTDRCNLRCFYCMPENGIKFLNRKELLSYEEMLRLINVFGDLGVNKVRITGGEPFVRNGVMDFLTELSQIETIQDLSVTTNGTLTLDKIPQLEDMGVKAVNLSLDSLDRERFHQITRKDLFDTVFETYHALLKSSIDVKINMVVMKDKNLPDIQSMLELTKEDDVAVRFIEEMPFNGTASQGNGSMYNMTEILDHISERYVFPDPPSSTSVNYRIEGYKGSFGIIPAFTRSFCGTCNRIRLTPQGSLRTCLYGEGVVNFKDLIRQGASDQDLAETLINVVQKRAIDGFVAERQRSASGPVSESMATIGG